MVRAHRSFGPALLAAALAGCVGVPPRELPVAENAAPAFPDPSPVALLPSRHFIVRARSDAEAASVSALAEAAYDRVMAHTGLWSFKPAGLYPIVVYADHEDYTARTREPDWSGGVAVGIAIYSYEGPQLVDTVNHEVTHLVFHEFMRTGEPRWLNEGLAVYEEISASPPEVKQARLMELSLARRGPMRFAAMVRFVPGSEQDRLISLWYLQSASLVSYLIDRGGTNGVANFLERTKNGEPLDKALAEAFPTLCDGLESLEAGWKRW